MSLDFIGMESIMGPKQKACLSAKYALDKKAENVVIMDLRKISGFCDYFVIASAESTRKAGAIADGIIEGLHKKQVKLAHIEGQKEGIWVLLDFVDVVVHIFYKDARSFYDLERLWQDAPKETVEEKCQTKLRAKN